jgi:DNA-binding PadR family transcriptional regulator
LARWGRAKFTQSTFATSAILDGPRLSMSIAGVSDKLATLTDNEGALLALILRRQPASAYQIGRAFDASPIHTLNTNKGKLYPLLQRLHERGLLSANIVEGDRRRTQLFECTEAGRAALKAWVCSIRPEHDLLHDPLRKKLQAFDLLRPEEQRQWVAIADGRLRGRLAEVEAFDAESEGPFGPLMKDSACEAIEARLRWLARLRSSLGAARDEGRP